MLWLGEQGLHVSQLCAIEVSVHHEAQYFQNTFRIRNELRHICSIVNEFLPIDRFVGIVLIPPCLSEQLCFVQKGKEPDVVFAPIYRMQVNADCAAEEPCRATGSCPEDWLLWKERPSHLRHFWINFWEKSHHRFSSGILFNLILVCNSQIHSILLWIMAFKDPHNSKM